MMVNATVKSANWMQCWSPPNAETDGNIPWARTYDVYSRAVEVSLNGVDWTTSNRAFTYYGESPLLASYWSVQRAHGLAPPWCGSTREALRLAA